MEVIFTKKYTYTSYANLDLGCKRTIPVSSESSCSDTKESFFNELDKLNDWCNEWFKTRYGEYEEQRGTVEKIIHTEPPYIIENDYPSNSVTITDIEPKSKEETVIEQIESSSSKKILEMAFKKMVEKMDNPAVKKAYDKKLKELK